MFETLGKFKHKRELTIISHHHLEIWDANYMGYVYSGLCLRAWISPGSKIYRRAIHILRHTKLDGYI